MFNTISDSDLRSVTGGQTCPTCGQQVPGGGQAQGQPQPGGGDPSAAGGDPQGGAPQQGGSQCEQILQAIASLIGQFMQQRGGQPQQ
jgi:hypothetical protein